MEAKIITGMIIMILMFHPVAPALSDTGRTIDHSRYAVLLDRYVKSGVVDYAGFKKEEDRLDHYLETLQSIEPESLARDETFAFYVNTYNAWTIKLILLHYPGIKSIKDIGSFFKSPWKKKFVRINGRIISLDEIEHGILRPVFRDPRVHFAVNCASKSCPPLLNKPYTGKNLNQQLDDSASRFINDPGFNRLEGQTLYVSKIFKWFSEDFKRDVAGFILRYAKGDLKAAMEKNKGALKIKYLDYDWSLNGL